VVVGGGVCGGHVKGKDKPAVQIEYSELLSKPTSGWANHTTQSGHCSKAYISYLFLC
jgi:hypothetical protein